MEKRILIIEDDITLASTLKYNLEIKGFRVTHAANASAAADLLYRQEYDLIVVDVNLPDGNGFDLCHKFREKHNTPVVFLTANDMEQDMLRGYESGADDYVTKPFSVIVFIRKVEALLKRTSPTAETAYSDGFLYVDFISMEARCGDCVIRLTPLEFRILKKFIQNPAQVLTRQSLLENLWDADENYVDEHALTSGISRLRGKIEQDGHKYIKTIYGMGYMWLGKSHE